MDEEFVTIREYRTPWEAHVAAACLEDEGIPCEIDDEDAATAFGSAVGSISVELMVPESLSERADEILLELEEAAQDADDDEDEEDEEQ